MEQAEIEGAFDRSIDAAMVAGHWWQESNGVLLPGENGHITVFEILFQDECRYFGFTGTTVFRRLWSCPTA